jgi:polysaccharide biosynthesis transport protein
LEEWEQERTLRHVPLSMSDPLEYEQPGLREYPRIPRPDPAGVEQSGLREYALLLWRKRVIILVTAAICVGATLAYCVLTKPTYQASASVLLEPPISQTLVEANSAGAVAPLPDVPDGIEVIESSAVAQLVAKTLPGAPSATATQVGTTDVVQVSVRSHSAGAAAAAANAYAKAYIRFEQKQTTDTFAAAQSQVQNKIDTIQLAIANLNSEIRAAPATTNVTPDESQLGDLQGELTTLQDQLQNYQFYASQGVTTEAGQVISTATVPSKPASPKPVEWTVLALIFGLILGAGIALLVNALSPKTA